MIINSNTDLMVLRLSCCIATGQRADPYAARMVTCSCGQRLVFRDGAWTRAGLDA